MKRVTLNADVGEGPGEEPLYPLLDVCHIACGGHCGDEHSMRTAVQQALAHGVQIGAHPSLPDREHFGRHWPAQLELEALVLALRQQLQALQSVARALGARVHSIKAHGALYHQMGRDPQWAQALVQALADQAGACSWVLMAGSPAAAHLRTLGCPVVAEGFADRSYGADGQLLSRSQPNALINEPQPAAAQALRLAQSGAVDTLCVHSDTPGALAIARAVREVLGPRRLSQA